MLREVLERGGERRRSSRIFAYVRSSSFSEDAASGRVRPMSSATSVTLPVHIQLDAVRARERAVDDVVEADRQAVRPNRRLRRGAVCATRTAVMVPCIRRR